MSAVDLRLTSEKGNADGGVLVVRVNEEHFRHSDAAALRVAHEAGERAKVALTTAGSQVPLLKIIPSLAGFIGIVDQLTQV
jgi:hypothetical protein